MVLRTRGYILEAASKADPLSGLNLDSVTEDGIVFETGRPVSFKYYRYQHPKSKKNSDFDREFEPSGLYMNHEIEDTSFTDEQEKAYAKQGVSIQHGNIKFNRPIVLKSGYGPNGWKQTLSLAFGDKRGRALTSAIRRAGYDGIVTVGLNRDGKYTGEIVALGK